MSHRPYHCPGEGNEGGDNKAGKAAATHTACSAVAEWGAAGTEAVAADLVAGRAGFPQLRLHKVIDLVAWMCGGSVLRGATYLEVPSLIEFTDGLGS